MTDLLDLDAMEARMAGVGFSFRHAHLKIKALIAAVRERDAEINRLRELFRIDGEQHGNALREARHEQDARIAAYSAEIARLRAPPGAERYRHKKRGTTYTVVGEAQTQVVGAPIEEGSTVTVYRSDTDGELWVRPAAEFHDGRFERLPDAVPAPPGADVMERSSRVWYTEIDGKPQSPGWTITTYASALQQYGDERAREATEAERRRCATIDHIDIDLIRRESVIAETEWLRRLLRWCRARLKHGSHQNWLDKYLAKGPSPAPEDVEPPVVTAKPRSQT